MLRISLAAFVVALSASSSLAAVDGEAFARRLTESLTDRTSLVLSYGAVRQDGSDVIIEDMTYLPTRASAAIDQDRPSIDVRFEGVRGDAASGFLARSISIPNARIPLSIGQHPLMVDVAGVTAKGLSIPGKNDTGVIDGSFRIEDASLRSLTVSSPEGTALSIDGMRMQTRIVSADKVISSASVSRFDYDITALLDAADRDIYGKLGLLSGTGRVSAGGSYDEATGTGTLENLQVTLSGAGSVDLSYVVAGYDRTTFDRTRDVNRALADGHPERTEATFLALGEAILIDSLSLGFADDGITERILSFAANQQNSSKDDIRRTVTGTVDNILQPLGIDSFKNGVVGALNAFLRDPGTFIVSFAPQEPVSISRIVLTALASPQDLPQFLGITIQVSD